MTYVLPLPVAVPLVAAAVLVATDHMLPRRIQDAIGIVAAAGSATCSALVLVASQRHDVIHWFGGWHVDGGRVALGIGFVADPLGAGMAMLATGLVLAVLVYSWTYTREEARSYNALVLTFGAGMAGFSLTGDIFNMFVWFELMGVSAYALTGFKVRELGPLQGAVNFSITNTVAAYMILAGIALLYGRTGALNLAQIGRGLASRPTDRLVVVALVLLFAGLMVKAAIVPFHFWLADAHAASPAPICALLSGAMVELGLFFVARVYWTVFDGPLAPHGAAVTDVLVALGVLTALVGALMCLLQRHLKRLLAYSTISHAGVMLTGIALLDPTSLSGVANLVLAHGLLKAGLFLVGGIVLVQFGKIDELELRGAGRGEPFLAALWFAATAGLVGIPFVGVFLAHELLDEGARARGFGWLAVVAMVATGVSAGAMLRLGARVFLGWGPADDDLLSTEPGEDPVEHTAAIPLLVTVAAVVIALGLVASVVPGLEQRTHSGAERFVDRAAYARGVLRGELVATERQPFALTTPSAASALFGLGAAAIALATAAFGLWHGRLPDAARAGGRRVFGPPVELVRDAHTGVVGDYLLWLAFGTLVIGLVWAFTL